MRRVMEPLIGKKFWSISRAIDMLCLFVGDAYTYSFKGKEIPVAEFAIHFQTQWRFVDGSSLLLGSRDIYEPYSQDVSDDWEYDIIGRKGEESSVFDVKARELNLAMKEATVTDVAVSDYGDLTIDFSNGITFQSFTPASEKDEEWRLIDYKAKEQYVVFDESEERSC